MNFNKTKSMDCRKTERMHSIKKKECVLKKRNVLLYKKKKCMDSRKEEVCIVGKKKYLVEKQKGCIV